MYSMLKKRLDSFLVYGLPGYDVAVLRNGKEDYRATVGYRDLAKTTPLDGSERYHLFRTQWVNHDFGYKVTMPRTVTIENLKLPEGCYITYLRKVFDNHADVSGEVLSDGTKNENPVTPTEKITVIYTDEKTDFRLNEGELLKNTSLIFEKK